MFWWAAAAVCAYFVKGLCGFANTLVFSAILGFTANNIQISPVELLLGWPTNLLIAFRERKAIDWKICAPLIAMVIAGSVPGMLLLRHTDAGMIKAFFGLVIIVVGLEMLLRSGNRGKTRQSGAVLAMIGIFSGFLCGLYGIGALLSAYVGRVTEDAHAFKANMCVVFAAENAFRVAAYMKLGLITPQAFLLALSLVPLMLSGLGLGMAASGKLDDAVVRRLVVLMLIVSGLVLFISHV